MEVLFSNDSFGRRPEAVDFPNKGKSELSISQEKVIGAETCE